MTTSRISVVDPDISDSGYWHGLNNLDKQLAAIGDKNNPLA